MFKPLQWLINLDDRLRTMARRVPRNESPEYDADRMFEEWTEESFSELDDASYAQRLEEEERDQGSRTTRLPEQHEGMGRKHKEIPDPWDDPLI